VHSLSLSLSAICLDTVASVSVRMPFWALRRAGGGRHCRLQVPSSNARSKAAPTEKQGCTKEQHMGGEDALRFEGGCNKQHSSLNH
jgi:hypothetical protein